MIDIRQMRHLLALAEHRNFARAALALHITQPALTRSIQVAEAQLGAALFDRGGRAVAPTAIGELVLAHARLIEAAARDLERDVQLALGVEIGSLLIGVGSFAGPTLVSETLARLHRAHPGLQAQVILAPWLELPDRLRQREIELMIGDMSDVQGLEEFEVTPLRRHAYMPVVRADHPVLALARARPADLNAYPLIGPALTPSLQEMVRRHLKRADDRARPAPLQAITCDSVAMLKAILVHSDAFALLSPFMVADELRARKLVALPELKTAAQSSYGLARLRGRTMSAPARIFCGLLAAWDAELAEQERSWLKRRARNIKASPGAV